MSRSGTGTKSAFGLNKMSSQRQTYNISVGEIVAQGSGKAKFENNIEYNLPQSHQQYKNNRYLTQWKLENQKRGTHIETIFDNAKKKGSSPGPSTYTHTGVVERTTKRGVLSKSDKISFVDAIKKSESKKKGPGDYKPEDKVKVPGVYTYNE